MSTTITEALAELKTLAARIEKKERFILNYLLMPEQQKDPLSRDGGSFSVIQRERQSISDLRERMVLLRSKIAEANADTSVTVNGTTRTIGDWLVWRRDHAPRLREFYNHVSGQIQRARLEAAKRGGTVVSGDGAAAKMVDIIVHMNEQELAEEIEDLELILGLLDGKLSLMNATIKIDV